MNREIGLLFIGIEEVDNKESGEKAVPKRPITGAKEGMIETVETMYMTHLNYINKNKHILEKSLEIDNEKWNENKTPRRILRRGLPFNRLSVFCLSVAE